MKTYTLENFVARASEPSIQSEETIASTIQCLQSGMLTNYAKENSHQKNAGDERAKCVWQRLSEVLDKSVSKIEKNSSHILPIHFLRIQINDIGQHQAWGSISLSDMMSYVDMTLRFLLQQVYKIHPDKYLNYATISENEEALYLPKDKLGRTQFTDNAAEYENEAYDILIKVLAWFLEAYSKFQNSNNRSR